MFKGFPIVCLHKGSNSQLFADMNSPDSRRRLSWLAPQRCVEYSVQKTWLHSEPSLTHLCLKYLTSFRTKPYALMSQVKTGERKGIKNILIILHVSAFTIWCVEDCTCRSLSNCFFFFLEQEWVSIWRCPLRMHTHKHRHAHMWAHTHMLSLCLARVRACTHTHTFLDSPKTNRILFTTIVYSVPVPQLDTKTLEIPRL